MIQGKRAIVTGSTSGIGLGMARRLASGGASVMLNGFGDAGEIEKIRADMEKSCNVKVGYHNADMSKPDEIEDLVKTTTDQFGGVDILVNNAGIQYTSPIVDFPVDRWDAVIAINLNSAFHTMRLCLPVMQKQGWGRIINIASAHGLVASVDKSAYVAAKHGIVGLTKVAALEHAASGITINAICPGWVLTPLVEKQIEARAEREGLSFEEAKTGLLSEKQPSGEFATPEQIAGIAMFLCSEDADQINGTQISVDGGWTAQ